MAIRMFCGFEQGTLAEGVTSSGTISIVSSGQRTGNYCLRSAPVGAASGVLSIGGIDAATSLHEEEALASANGNPNYIGFAFKAVTLPAATEETLVDFTSPAMGTVSHLRITSGGILKYYKTSGAVLIATGTTALVAGTWYYIELLVTASTATTSPYEVRINGVTEFSGQANQCASASTVVSLVRLGKNNVNGNTVDFYYDDIYTSSTGFLATTTAFPAVWRKGPVGAGNAANWTNGLGTTFTQVDEVPPESDGTDASYIQASATEDNMAHNFAVATNASVGITGTLLAAMVDAWVRTLSTSGTSVAIVRMQATNLSHYSTPAVEWTTSYTSRRVLSETDPYTLTTAWTEARLDSLVIGVGLGAIAQAQRLSAIGLGVLSLVTAVTTNTRTVGTVRANLVLPTTETRTVTPNAANLQATLTRTVSTVAANVGSATRTVGLVKANLLHYDVVIGAANGGDASKFPRLLVSVSGLISYQFFVTTGSVQYRKTTDGGATWSAAVTVRSGTPNSVDVWYDRWTTGNTGTLIHIWYLDPLNDDFFYRTLDTASDTLGTERLAVAGTSASTGNPQTGAVSRAGNLGTAIQNSGAGFSEGFYTSDDGITWTLRASPLVGVSAYPMILLPANLADPRDFWLLLWNGSNSTLYLKTFDDDADSWSEVTLASSMSMQTPPNFSAAIRHSDGHAIVVAWSNRGVATADLRLWDITDAGSIVEKTPLISDNAFSNRVSVTIDQNTDDIYVFYAGTDAATETLTTTKIYYKVSTDGGATWSAEVPYSQDPGGDFSHLYSDHGSTNFRLGATWWEAVAAGAGTLLYSHTNSVAISAGITVPASVNLYATRERTVAAVAANLGTTLERTVTPASVNLAVLQTRTVTPASTNLLATLSRTVTPASTNLQSVGLARTVATARVNLQSVGLERTVVTARTNLGTAGLVRTVSTARVNLQSVGLARTVTPARVNVSVTLSRTVIAAVNLLATGTRTITPARVNLLRERLVPAAANLSLALITRTATPVAVNLQSLGLARTVAPAAVNLSASPLRTVTSVAANLSSLVIAERTVTPVAANLLAAGVTRTVTAAVNLQSVALARTLTPSRVNLGLSGVTRTVTGAANLYLTSTRTVTTTRGNVYWLWERTVATVRANLGLTSTRTVPGAANYKATASRTVPESANFHATQTRTVPATVNLLAVGLARTLTPDAANLLATGLTRTVVTARANIAQNFTRTVGTARVNLTVPLERSFSAAVNLLQTNTRTVPVAFNSDGAGSRSLAASVNLLSAGLTRTVTAAANIATVLTRTSTPVRANVVATTTRVVPAIGNLFSPGTRTVPEHANFLAGRTASVPAAANLLATGVTTTVTTARANLALAGVARTVATVRVNVYSPGTRTVPVAANLALAGNLRTVTTAQVNLVTPGLVRTVTPARANLGTGGTRTLPAVANLKATGLRTVPAATNLSLTASRTVPATANLTATGTRTVPAQASLSLAFERTVTASVNLARPLTRVVPVSVHFHATETHLVPATANLLLLGLTRTVGPNEVNLVANRFTRRMGPVRVNLLPAYRPGMRWPPIPGTTLWGIWKRRLNSTDDID